MSILEWFQYPYWDIFRVSSNGSNKRRVEHGTLNLLHINLKRFYEMRFKVFEVTTNIFVGVIKINPTEIKEVEKSGFVLIRV